MEYVDDSIEPMSLTRSAICIGSGYNQLPFGVFSASRLLRVLYFINVEFTEFPTEIFEFVNLRFLVVRSGLLSTAGLFLDESGVLKIPRGISRLRNLQTLIAPHCKFDVPSELWQLSELRNLKVYGFELLKDEEMSYCVMKKLQMISSARLTKEESSWDGFFKSIPNIKRLAINDGFRRKSTTFDLSHLHKLEILRCKYIDQLDIPDGSSWRSLVVFPCHIRKLVLSGSTMNSRVSRTLCALHKLEVLKIISCLFLNEKHALDVESEEEWEVADGEVFCSLQCLCLEDSVFVRWIANETNFPGLRHLYVADCENLEEIPSSIGEIPTLQLIDLKYCTKSIVASAERIVEEQFKDGNYDLKLLISHTLNR